MYDLNKDGNQANSLDSLIENLQNMSKFDLTNMVLSKDEGRENQKLLNVKINFSSITHKEGYAITSALQNYYKNIYGNNFLYSVHVSEDRNQLLVKFNADNNHKNNIFEIPTSKHKDFADSLANIPQLLQVAQKLGDDETIKFAQEYERRAKSEEPIHNPRVDNDIVNRIMFESQVNDFINKLSEQNKYDKNQFVFSAEGYKGEKSFNVQIKTGHEFNTAEVNNLNKLVREYYDNMHGKGFLKESSTGNGVLSLNFNANENNSIFKLEGNKYQNFADSFFNIKKLSEIISEHGANSGLDIGHSYIKDCIKRRDDPNSRVFAADIDNKSFDTKARKIIFNKNPSSSRYSKMLLGIATFVITAGAIVAKLGIKLNEDRKTQEADNFKNNILNNPGEGYIVDENGFIKKDKQNDLTENDKHIDTPIQNRSEINQDQNKVKSQQNSIENLPSIDLDNFKNSFSEDKSVISAAKNIKISTDGKQVYDGNTLKDISNIQSIVPEKMSNDEFFEKLAKLLERKNSQMLKDDFTNAFSFASADNTNETIIISMNKKIVVNPVMEAVINMAGGELKSGNIPAKALEFLKNAFYCPRAQLQLSSIPKDEGKRWEGYVLERDNGKKDFVITTIS